MQLTWTVYATDTHHSYGEYEAEDAQEAVGLLLNDAGADEGMRAGLAAELFLADVELDAEGGPRIVCNDHATRESLEPHVPDGYELGDVHHFENSWSLVKVDA
jgi:hypothetical protein